LYWDAAGKLTGTETPSVLTQAVIEAAMQITKVPTALSLRYFIFNL
jgi:hypothetical protein